MVVVVVTMELSIPGITSLKEKRRVLKSLLAHIKNNFNVSISEVADNDVLRKTTIGAAIVTNENSYGHQVMAKLVHKIEANPEVLLLDYRTENY